MFNKSFVSSHCCTLCATDQENNTDDVEERAYQQKEASSIGDFNWGDIRASELNDRLLMAPSTRKNVHIQFQGDSNVYVIPGDDGQKGPNLFVHYVEQHNWIPPEDFINKVLNGVVQGFNLDEAVPDDELLPTGYLTVVDSEGYIESPNKDSEYMVRVKTCWVRNLELRSTIVDTAGGDENLSGTHESSNSFERAYFGAFDKKDDFLRVLKTILRTEAVEIRVNKYLSEIPDPLLRNFQLSSDIEALRKYTTQFDLSSESGASEDLFVPIMEGGPRIRYDQITALKTIMRKYMLCDGNDKLKPKIDLTPIYGEIIKVAIDKTATAIGQSEDGLNNQISVFENYCELQDIDTNEEMTVTLISQYGVTIGCSVGGGIMPLLIFTLNVLIDKKYITRKEGDRFVVAVNTTPSNEQVNQDSEDGSAEKKEVASRFFKTTCVVTAQESDEQGASSQGQDKGKAKRGASPARLT